MSFHENPDFERQVMRAREEEIERSAEHQAGEIDLDRDRGALARLIDRVRTALIRHDESG